MRIITFLSGKGGVGKTTVACNLAISLAKLKKKVIIIDADWAMANLDILFGLKNTPYTLLDVIDGKDLDLAIYDAPFGVKVIPAGFTLDWERPLGDEIIDVIEKLSERFDYILIDAPPGKDASSIFFKGFEFVVVTIPETSAISDALKTKAVAERYGMHFLGVIVNRATGSLEEISKREIESAFESEILGWIPEEILMKKAVALEKPITSLFLDSEVNKIFENIAKRINDQSPSKIGVMIEELKKAKEKGKKSIENLYFKIEEGSPRDVKEKNFIEDISFNTFSFNILEPEEKTVYYSIFDVEKEFSRDISFKIEEKKDKKLIQSVFEVEELEQEPNLKIIEKEDKHEIKEFTPKVEGLEFLDEVRKINRRVDHLFVREVAIDLKNLVELIDKYRKVIGKDRKMSEEYEDLLKEREKKLKPYLPFKEFDFYTFQKWQSEIEKIEKMSLKDYRWYMVLGIFASLLVALIVFSMDPYLSALLFLISAASLGSFLYLDLSRSISNRYKRLNQEILDYLINIVKEANINPSEFILNLSHKDYRGVKYEKLNKGYKATLIL
ncbi:MAG: cell division ATPase MinD [Candidatus Hydrothermarchaeota archaeon]